MAERVYIGVKKCGCATAIMVDDEKTTSQEIADFAHNMAKTGRRVENTSREDGLNRLKRHCEHEPKQETLNV